MSKTAVKIILCLLVILIIGIVLVKASNRATADRKTKTGFGVTTSLPTSATAASESSSNALGSTAGFGIPLKAFSDLDQLAQDFEGVCVFVPDKGNPNPNTEAVAAILKAQATLKNIHISFGFFQLSTDSPDYATFAKIAQAPGFLIARKNAGMRAVVGEVTEQNVLQTWVATKRQIGCGCCPP